MPATSASTRFNFTKQALEKLVAKHQGERLQVRDTKTPGLIVELRESGAMSFYLYKRIDGRPTRYRIGGFPETTVEQARKVAAVKLGEIAGGKNPAQERRQARHEHTLKGLFDYWLEIAKQRKKSWKEDERQYRTILAPWHNRRLSTISKREVQQFHNAIGEDRGPYAANRVLALLRAMFNKAVDIGFNGNNPCRGVPKFREQSRDRFLQPDEIPRFFAALEAEPNETLRDFFKVALFVGARRANVQEMRWEQISFDRQEWRIPDTKTGDALTVHLSTAAMQVLMARRAAAGESPWVFPSRSKTGHITEPKVAWKRILTAAGLQDLRVHDLRRTLGSWQAATGASLPVIGKSLGHKQQSTTAVYARLNLDPVRSSVDLATAAILAAAKPKAKGKGARNGKA